MDDHLFLSSAKVIYGIKEKSINEKISTNFNINPEHYLHKWQKVIRYTNLLPKF